MNSNHANQFLYSQWLLHTAKNVPGQIVFAQRSHPEQHQNKGQGETNVEQDLQNAIFATILQRIPMHTRHSQTGEREDCADNAACHRNAELDDNCGRRATEGNNLMLQMSGPYRYKYSNIYVDCTPCASMNTDAVSLKLR